jgi:Co/Zn/Cd efflux system component
MTSDQLVTVLISVVAALTSAKAWDFWKHRSLENKADKNLYRDDLRKEVQTLREKLDEANLKLLQLAERLSAMTVRVEFLEAENIELKGAQGVM